MKSMISRHLRPCVVLGMLAILANPLTAKPPGGKGGGGGGGEDPPSPPTPEVSYSIQFLDTLGGTDITAYGMNQHGDVVGLSETEVIGLRSWQHGYVYDSDSQVMVDLHDLFVVEGLIAPFDYDGGNGWIVTAAYDINDGGQIIGRLANVVNAKLVDDVRFRYTPADGDGGTSVLEEIPPLVEGGYVIVRAINHSGVVAGYALGADGLDHAITWSDAQAGTIDLGALNGQDTIPNDINDQGELCGQLNGVSRAWRLGNDGFEDLGKLQKGKGGSSFGGSINSFGDVAGTSSISNGTYRAFLYTDAQGMKDLGTLGGNDSYGGGLNNLGEVVGTSRLSNLGASHAFLYTQGVMLDLEDAIDGFSESIYYALLDPIGINDAGEIFGTTSTGTGLDRQVFILTPN